MVPVQLPSCDTEETKALCQEIAKKSHGVCLLAFSRGKDSLFAWLYLKKYFRSVIPFHCSSYPMLRHVTRVLDYYEEALCDRGKGERILRLVGEEVPMALPRMMYQLAEEYPALSELNTPDFSKLDIMEVLRKELNLPRCWCAVGIQAGDSIDRRIYCKKTGGRNDNNLTFYPTWNITRSDMIAALRASGLRLSDEYLWQNRTLGGVPSYTCNRVYAEHYPEDWERIQAIYPLCLAKSIRERFLDRIWERKKAAGIVEDDTGDGDDGTDIMADMGMNPEGETEDA